jgi:hypothetical protein
MGPRVVADIPKKRMRLSSSNPKMILVMKSGSDRCVYLFIHLFILSCRRSEVLFFVVYIMEAKTIQVLVLESDEYRSLGIFRSEQTLPSRIVPELPVGVELFFV